MCRQGAALTADLVMLGRVRTVLCGSSSSGSGGVAGGGVTTRSLSQHTGDIWVTAISAKFIIILRTWLVHSGAPL